MSTSTSLSRTSTTVPRTTSPSSMSPTPRLNQSSMLSSGASVTSRCAPARLLALRLSLSISECFLLDRFAGANASLLAVLPVVLLLQLCDGAHHLVRGITIPLLAPFPRQGLEV